MNNPHQRARLTVYRREQIVARIVPGQKAAKVAATFGVSLRTVRKWLARFRAGGQAALARPAPNTVGPGIHINAVGGDSPGKTEIDPDILRRAAIFVEYTPQTRIEGEIQQLAPDHHVTELWQVIAGHAPGRRDPREVTLFASVGFAIEDFVALAYIRDKALETGLYSNLDMVADPDDPRDLFGMLMRAAP